MGPTTTNVSLSSGFGICSPGIPFQTAHGLGTLVGSGEGVGLWPSGGIAPGKVWISTGISDAPGLGTPTETIDEPPQPQLSLVVCDMLPSLLTAIV